jgi:beta-barrel assembly-enhancing protease
MVSIVHGACNNVMWACGKVGQGVSACCVRVSSASKKCLNVVLPVNPVTKSREFRIMPTIVENWIGRMYYDRVCSQMSSFTFGGAFDGLRGRDAEIKAIGAKLVKHCDRELPYEFRLINSSMVNAVCLPGGKIAITTALASKLNYNRDKIAWVLGHEITHACAAHSAKRVQFGLLVWLAGRVAEVVVGVFVRGKLEEANKGKKHENKLSKGQIKETSNAVQWCIGKVFTLAAFFVSTWKSRDNEYQADRVGLKYVVKAGYAAGACLDVMDVFIAENKGKESKLAEFVHTHPNSSARKEALEALLAKDLRPANVEEIIVK